MSDVMSSLSCLLVVVSDLIEVGSMFNICT